MAARDPGRLYIHDDGRQFLYKHSWQRDEWIDDGKLCLQEVDGDLRAVEGRKRLVVIEKLTMNGYVD